MLFIIVYLFVRPTFELICGIFLLFKLFCIIHGVFLFTPSCDLLVAEAEAYTLMPLHRLILTATKVLRRTNITPPAALNIVKNANFLLRIAKDS